MYYKALRTLPRPELCEQPEAKRQNLTVKWNLDDELNVTATDLQVASTRECVNLVTHTNFTALYVL